MAMPHFRSPSVVAEDLGLYESTVRNLARKHRIFTKVGNRVMFAPEDVEKLLEKIKNPPQPDWAEDMEDPFG